MTAAGGQSSLSPSSLTLPFRPLPSVPLQVKIFEEDFQRERSDRERMNEEKEELKKQVERLQAQVTLSNAQVRAADQGRGTRLPSQGRGAAWRGPGETGGRDARGPSSSAYLCKSRLLSDPASMVGVPHSLSEVN